QAMRTILPELKTMGRLLAFQADTNELTALNRRHLALGLVCTWIVGILLVHISRSSGAFGVFGPGWHRTERQAKTPEVSPHRHWHHRFHLEAFRGFLKFEVWSLKFSVRGCLRFERWQIRDNR